MTVLEKIFKRRSLYSATFSNENTDKDVYYLAVKTTVQRTVFILSIFLGLLFSLFSICGLFVFKIEEYQGDEVQVGLWTLCTTGDDPGDYDCTDGSHGFEFYWKNPEIWYDCFRFFLAAATFFLFAALMFSLLVVILTNDTTYRRFWVSAALHLVAALLILISQTIFALYYDMNVKFMSELRESGLGWFEWTPYNESYSDGYYVTWGCFGTCLMNMLLSLLMNKYDKEYIITLAEIKRAGPIVITSM